MGAVCECLACVVCSCGETWLRVCAETQRCRRRSTVTPTNDQNTSHFVKPELQRSWRNSRKLNRSVRSVRSIRLSIVYVSGVTGLQAWFSSGMGVSRHGLISRQSQECFHSLGLGLGLEGYCLDLGVGRDDHSLGFGLGLSLEGYCLDLVLGLMITVLVLVLVLVLRVIVLVLVSGLMITVLVLVLVLVFRVIVLIWCWA